MAACVWSSCARPVAQARSAHQLGARLPSRQQQTFRRRRRAAVWTAAEGDAAPSQPPPLSGPSMPPALSSQAMAMAASSLQPEEPAAAAGEQGELGKLPWAQRYKQQLASGGSAGSSSGSTSSAGGSGGDAASPSGRGGEAGSEQSEAGGGEQPFLLPLMTLSKVKLPTESVPLQIFEPRYRLMFKLVNGSASRRFGVVLADKSTGMMESVGCLVELTHFVVVPERRRVFINGRVVGRFKTEQVVSDKPFVVVQATHYSDSPPQELPEQLQLAALELRVWQAMQDVKQLASKLFTQGSTLGNEIFSLEVRRWAPDAAARESVPTAPSADPTLMRMVQLAGLLGDEETVSERTTEYLCSDALRQDYSEAERRERFSFALARTLDMGPERMQQLLYTRSTAERLRASEELVLEGRAYLAARSTLRDTF